MMNDGSKQREIEQAEIILNNKEIMKNYYEEKRDK